MQGHLQLQCLHVSLLTYFPNDLLVFSLFPNFASFRKRRGHQPTGILITTAKATGFSSVSEMLLKGAERLNHEKIGADMVASLKKVGILIKLYNTSRLLWKHITVTILIIASCFF